MLIDDIIHYVMLCQKRSSYLGTEPSLVMLTVVRLVQRHHVVPHFDEKFDGAQTGGEPVGILLDLQLLTNTHVGLTFTTDTG